MMDLFKLILGVLASLFRSRAKLAAEMLILRQQINVVLAQNSERPREARVFRATAVPSGA
jgi:hypothetical protein